MLVSVELDNVHEHMDVVEKVSKALNGQKRIIAVTGAGISVSAGIPDFRSADGLYARVLNGPENTGGSKTAKGKDFFDASFFNNQETRPAFNRFVAELRNLCVDGQPTPTHLFINELAQSGRLLRWYTQNIDGLERAVGLKTSSCLDSSSCKRVPVVTLHGTLDRLICSLCKSVTGFTESYHDSFKNGESPLCEKCKEFSTARQANGRRAIKGGILRPDIVLYNEPHPHGDLIADFLSSDISKRPTVLIVLGTSLKVVGLKKMIKNLAKAVKKERDGLALFINKTAAPRGEWKTVFDYEFLGECDLWIQQIQKSTQSLKRIPEPPESPKMPVRLLKKDGRIDQMFKIVRKANSGVSEKPLDDVRANSGASGKPLDDVRANSGASGKPLDENQSEVGANS